MPPCVYGVKNRLSRAPCAQVLGARPEPNSRSAYLHARPGSGQAECGVPAGVRLEVVRLCAVDQCRRTRVATPQALQLESGELERPGEVRGVRAYDCPLLKVGEPVPPSRGQVKRRVSTIVVQVKCYFSSSSHRSCDRWCPGPSFVQSRALGRTLGSSERN